MPPRGFRGGSDKLQLVHDTRFGISIVRPLSDPTSR